MARLMPDADHEETTAEELNERLKRVRKMIDVAMKPQRESPQEVEYVCPECGNRFTMQVGTIFTIDGSPSGEIVCRECYLKARNVMVVPAKHEYDGVTPDKVLSALDQIGVNLNVHGHLQFDMLEDGPARSTIDEFVSRIAKAGRMGFVAGIYVWGPTGTGKSQLAVCTMRKLMEMGLANEKNVVYDRARAMVTQLQDRYSTGRVDEFSEKRRRARLWVYDDAGTEKLTPDAFRIMEDIFDAREGKPTIITSNLNRSHLIERWMDAADVDRFRSRLALYNPIQLTGKDRRFA